MAHEHVLVVRDNFLNPETGIRHVERKCVCGLSERSRYDKTTCVSVRYRWDPLGGGWAAADEILRLTLPVVICDACGGFEGADVCEKCEGTFVMQPDGSKLPGPPKKKRQRR